MPAPNRMLTNFSAGWEVTGVQDEKGNVRLEARPLLKQDQPRISTKLAATFPWKLRKYLKKP